MYKKHTKHAVVKLMFLLLVCSSYTVDIPFYCVNLYIISGWRKECLLFRLLLTTVSLDSSIYILLQPTCAIYQIHCTLFHESITTHAHDSDGFCTFHIVSSMSSFLFEGLWLVAWRYLSLSWWCRGFSSRCQPLSQGLSQQNLSLKTQFLVPTHFWFRTIHRLLLHLRSMWWLH